MTARLSEAFLRAVTETNEHAICRIVDTTGLDESELDTLLMGVEAESQRLKPLLIAAARVFDALESEPIEVVGSTKDGRPLHKWTKHERVEAALSALKAAIGGEHG